MSRHSRRKAVGESVGESEGIWDGTKKKKTNTKCTFANIEVYLLELVGDIDGIGLGGTV